MTRRSGILACMTIVIVGLTLLSRDPRIRSIPVATDTPVTLQGAAAAAPARNAAVGRPDESLSVPHYTEPDRAGIAAYVDGRFDDAFDLFSRAVADDPEDAESFSNLGQALVRLGRHDEAIEHFDRALEINPSRWAYHFNLANALGETGRWGRAVTEYEAAAMIAPGEYVTHYNLGRALHEHGRDQAAIVAYQRAIDLNRDEPAFHLSLGVSFETQERWSEALLAYRTYLALAPESPRSEAMKWHVVALTENQERFRAG